MGDADEVIGCCSELAALNNLLCTFPASKQTPTKPSNHILVLLAISHLVLLLFSSFLLIFRSFTIHTSRDTVHTSYTCYHHRYGYFWQYINHIQQHESMGYIASKHVIIDHRPIDHLVSGSHMYEVLYLLTKLL